MHTIKKYFIKLCNKLQKPFLHNLRQNYNFLTFSTVIFELKFHIAIKEYWQFCTKHFLIKY
ncbi:hypothetical protein BpHYR1_003554 [Brachionus plicatilis]|uniref:Uncharacterized protein n=1 Tax=Brachionus plicatilis TaxID=10195 RepID=A0A3M7QDD1_BRAPC|nr:hypothetical protein BpHYR1_003554 [Brachionus plicatilis]